MNTRLLKEGFFEYTKMIGIRKDIINNLNVKEKYELLNSRFNIDFISFEKTFHYKKTRLYTLTTPTQIFDCKVKQRFSVENNPINKTLNEYNNIALDEKVLHVLLQENDELFNLLCEAYNIELNIVEKIASCRKERLAYDKAQMQRLLREEADNRTVLQMKTQIKKISDELNYNKIKRKVI